MVLARGFIEYPWRSFLESHTTPTTRYLPIKVALLIRKRSHRDVDDDDVFDGLGIHANTKRKSTSSHKSLPESRSM